MITFSNEGFYDIVMAGHSILKSSGKFIPCSDSWNESDDTSTIQKKILLDELPNFSCGKLYKRILWENVYFPVDMLIEDMYINPTLFYRAKHICIHKEALYYYSHENTNSIMRSKEFTTYMLNKYGRFLAWEEHARVASKLVPAFERECRQKAIAYAIKAYMLNQGNGILSPKQEAEVKTYLSLHKEIPLSDKKEWQRTCIIENKYKGFMCIVGRLYRIVFNMRNKIRSRKINRHVQK